MEVLNDKAFKTKVFNYEAGNEWKFEGDLPAIVDFYADWCGPCRALAPVLAEISEEYKGKINIYKVNTEQSPDIAAMFGIRSIPTLLFIPKQGTPVLSPGFAPKAELVKVIEEILTPNSVEE